MSKVRVYIVLYKHYQNITPYNRITEYIRNCQEQKVETLEHNYNAQSMSCLMTVCNTHTYN